MSTRDFIIVHATMSAMFDGRIQKLKDQLKREKLDGVFISSVSNIEYLTGFTNFSKDEREAYLFVSHDFGYIITDGRYSEAVKNQVPHLKLFEKGHQQSIENLFKKHKKEVKTLGIEEDNLTIVEFKKLKKHFKNTKHFNVGHLRSPKSNEELDKIKKACKIGDLVFNYIIKKIKVGVSEKNIAGELENFIRKSGAILSFPPIVAFGKNSSIPHHQTSETVLSNNPGQFILLDFGVKISNYCSDMTRTVFFGKPNKKQIRMYEVVLKAQQEAVDFINGSIKSGKKIKASDVDKVARKYIRSEGFPDIPHSLGHGIGLEVHEHPSLSPKSKDYLKERMVFSIEPGIYIPDFGSPRSTRLATKRARVEAGGVRIEDLFVLEKTGLRQLTTSPKEIIQI